MEYSSPPPLFKQGASARAKVVFFSLIAIALLVVDARMSSLTMLRQLVGTALYPLQSAALAPRNALYTVRDYFTSQTRLENENQRLQQQRVNTDRALQQAAFLTQENQHLRSVLKLSERLNVRSITSEILYDARDPFIQKIVVDRGSQHQVAAGQPVLDDSGVVGQVTRVFPFTSEVSLLTDKDQAIPVQILRNGLRSVLYGNGQPGALDLRFVVANSDVRLGDLLVTSGIDGLYPSGLAVARVVQIENKGSGSFAHIICQPVAGLSHHRQLLILLTAPEPQTPDAVLTSEAPAIKAGSRAARGKIPPAAANTPTRPRSKSAKTTPPATPNTAPINR